MSLQARIKTAIEESGKSKADIARACGVTNAAVTLWLNGTTKSLQAEKALALEQATGFRAVWLAFGKGPRKLEDPAEPYWPFAKLPIARFEALSPEDRGYVQRRLIQAVQECETPDGDDKNSQKFLTNLHGELENTIASARNEKVSAPRRKKA